MQLVYLFMLPQLEASLSPNAKAVYFPICTHVEELLVIHGAAYLWDDLCEERNHDEHVGDEVGKQIKPIQAKHAA